MAKITIRNSSKAVKVLKAVGLKPLRLFPGYNYAEGADLDKYFKNNPAAEGIKAECLKVVQSPTKDMKKEAEKAQAKNDELNRAKKIIQKSDAALTTSKETVSAQKVTIKEQGEKIATQDKAIAELMERLSALEAKKEK